ncbi:MAG: PRD domain-containing protein, partial [Enterobacteriaceae bacterium]
LCVRSKTLLGTSTLHVMEAVSKALSGDTLEEIYDSVRAISFTLGEQSTSPGKSNAIMVIGELASYLKIKSCLQSELPAVSFFNASAADSAANLAHLKQEYHLICVISDQTIVYKQCFTCSETLSGKNTHKIKALIDEQNTYSKMSETLRRQLKQINVDAVLQDVRKFNENIQRRLKITIDNNILIGVSLHFVCMMERIINHTYPHTEHNTDLLDRSWATHKPLFLHEINVINNKYRIQIPDNEVNHIMNFLLAAP